MDIIYKLFIDTNNISIIVKLLYNLSKNKIIKFYNCDDNNKFFVELRGYKKRFVKLILSIINNKCLHERHKTRRFSSSKK